MSAQQVPGGHLPPTREEILVTLIRVALAEDVGPGDWTSAWTIPGEARGEAEIVAKQDVVAAGMEAARRVFLAVDPDLEVRALCRDGDRVERGGTLLQVRGAMRSILTAERTALNFLGRLSGIATLTRTFVDAVAGTRARIVDTRKTTPGWRFLEKDAVLAGGGANHRMGLYDMVLIKDNHIAACGGIRRALEAVARENHAGLPVEVEVTSLAELGEALQDPPDRILLDNMSPREMTEAVQRVSSLGDARPELEASGNVRLETVRDIARTGVDLISVGALTHSAPTADLSLRVRD